MILDLTNGVRSQYLLDGRRVTVRDLLDAELLTPGADLVFHRPRVGKTYNAVVTDSGRIRLEDGQEYASPSRAAMVAAGIRAVDGWNCWIVATSGRPLDALRQELLDQTLTRVVRVIEASDDEHVLTQRVHQRLREARRRAEEGQPEEITVRELLSFWGLTGRGDQISRIEADLANHGLVTVPSFRKVTLDTVVRLVTITEVTDAEPAAQSVDVPGDGLDDIGIGLAVGNLVSADRGVEGVSPSATLNEAITKMLLNDYSQLAVLSGPRNLVGAVSWKSIAQARHSHPGAELSDAIVDAHIVGYDKELIDVLPQLQTDDFFFVRNEQNLISGIVTTADVAGVYRDLASPFFLLGDLDRTLRRLIARLFDIEDVVAVCDPDRRRLAGFNDMSMGDYQRMLERPESWDRLGWPLDRASFIKRLDEIRRIRNDVMHFNPDPPPLESVRKLRNLIKLLRDYGDAKAS